MEKTITVRELKKIFLKKELDLPVYIRTIDKDGEEKMFKIPGVINWGNFLEISSGDELEKNKDGDFIL